MAGHGKYQSIFENEELSYEEKIAEVIWMELNSENGVRMAKKAIESAKSKYIYRDIDDASGKNGLLAQVIGVTKFMGVAGVPTFFKMVKSDIRTPPVESINEENYLQALFNLLNGPGKINKDSLKGFLLRELFNYTSELLVSDLREFFRRYKLNQIKLKSLWSFVSFKLSAKINSEIVKNIDFGPQSKASFSDNNS